MSLAYITSTTDNELIKIVSIPSDDDEDVIKTVLLIEAFVMVTPDWDKGRFIVRRLRTDIQFIIQLSYIDEYTTIYIKE